MSVKRAISTVPITAVVLVTASSRRLHRIRLEAEDPEGIRRQFAPGLFMKEKDRWEGRGAH